MRYAFYPGCSLESTGRDFLKSFKAVCRVLEVEIEEIPEWVCCGSTPAHTTSPSLAVALPAVNLQKAKDMNLPVITACASCYARLRTANHKIRNEAGEADKVERITGRPYDGKVEVKHLLDALVNDLGLPRVKAKVTKPLQDLKIASYYGCLLTRPPEIVAFEEAEHPVSMDRLLEAAGAEAVDWPYKTECCGAGLSVTNVESACRLGHKLLSMAREAGAECLAVACPLCQANLDLRQVDAARAHGWLEEMPVLYITQLLGLALGLGPDELGIEGSAVSALPLLRKKGLAR